MSKMFLYTGSYGNMKILEISSSQPVKDIYKTIKTRVPGASIGIYGARDFETLQRTQRNLGKFNLYKCVEEFIAEITV